MLLRDDDFNNIVKIVQNKTLKNIEDWKKLAKDVNGLLDLPVIAYTTSGKLTNEMKKKYIDIGIDNMYINVNAKPDLPVLPWMKESDIEPPIPNI